MSKVHTLKPIKLPKDIVEKGGKKSSPTKEEL